MQRSDDLGRVGPLGASILALVRYVTALPGDTDGRREIDGQTWWRASATDIVEALGGGLPPRSVSRTVLQLTESGDLRAIPTHDFHGDRAKAYRVSDLTSANMAEEETASDLTSANMADPLGQNRHTPSANMADLPPSEELEEEKQEGGEREPGPLDVEVVPDSAYTPSLQTESENRIDPAAGPGEVFDAEVVIEPEPNPDPEPGLFCAKHMPDGPGRPCGPCGDARRVHDRWERRQPPPPPRSKQRDWWELTEKIRAAEDRAEEARASGQEAAPPPVIEAKAAPAPKSRPRQPEFVTGPYGEPRCRRHGHRPATPADCAGCRAAETAAGESP